MNETNERGEEQEKEKLRRERGKEGAEGEGAEEEGELSCRFSYHSMKDSEQTKRTSEEVRDGNVSGLR